MKSGSAIRNHITEPSSLEELTRTQDRIDFDMRSVGKSVPIRYDCKRRPLVSQMRDVQVEIDGEVHDLVYVPTVPWGRIEDLDLARERVERLIKRRGKSLGDDNAGLPPSITREAWLELAEALGDLAG